MHPRCTNLLAALAAAAYLLASGTGAQADAEKCKSAILKASSGFVQAKVKALQRCRQRVVKGQLPPNTDCESNLETGQAITKARAKLESRIVRGCGGGDEACGTADDDDLASIGWDIGTCPNFALEGCSNPIGSCADIVTCLECMDDAAVDAAIALDYDGFKLTDPVSERDLNRCQLAIGKESVKFLVVQSKILARCWQAVNKGKATAPCPDPGDGKAQAAIERAAAKRTLAICKACGGDDEACGTPDDLTPEEIGFNSYCTIFVSCADTIESLEDIVQCLDCDARLEGGCIDQNAVPAFTPVRPLCDSILFQVPETELDYTLPAREGEASLATGFTPDPLSVAVTAGGGVDVSYLGSACAGFANAAPDFQVNFGGGGSLLRFYFVGTGDTTMVLNDPFGNFYCVDDSFGTVNPTIDFNNPAGGTYDVWVGSFAFGADVSGTLFVTQSADNHP